MAIHLKIKTETDNSTHFDGIFDDHTLCGLEVSGDEFLRIKPSKQVSTKVTCQDCIKIVSYCQNIKRIEYK